MLPGTEREGVFPSSQEMMKLTKEKTKNSGGQNMASKSLAEEVEET